MTTCRIQWVDDNGRPTPDTNPAVGIAVYEAHEFQVNGRSFFAPEQRYPICEHHAAILRESLIHAGEHPRTKWWRLEQLPQVDASRAQVIYGHLAPYVPIAKAILGYQAFTTVVQDAKDEVATGWTYESLLRLVAGALWTYRDDIAAARDESGMLLAREVHKAVKP